ncbi:MAG: SDR family oxidoreductase [Chloroflexi bacterium]|nr:SDR family oxidoreductase [Chloroflexota bacterium]
MERIVLITGATGELGPVVAQVMAETGARLALSGRRQESLDELVGALALPEERLLLKAADLTDSGQVAALVQAIESRWGGVDILLNCAGGWMGGKPLAEVSDEDWERAMNINLVSAFKINRAVLSHMAEQGWGRIVNVGSRAAEAPGVRQVGYNVSKAGVVALTRSIAAEYRRRGVAANVILPSVIDTPPNRASMPDADYSRWVKPRDIAEMMRFLCSEAGGSVNGAVIAMYGQM